MDDDLKKCSKCKIEKMKTDFYFRNTNQKYRSECMKSNKKNGEIKTMIN